MTCGISCPLSDGSKMGFVLRLMCNAGSWIMCSPLSLVFIIIGIVAFYFIWSRIEDDKRDKIGIFFKLGLTVLLLIVFFPSIKAFLFSSPYQQTIDYCTSSSHCSISTDCGLSTDVPSAQQITGIDYWDVDCGSGTGGVGFHLSFISGSGTIIPEDGYTEVPSYANVTSDGGSAYTLRLSCDAC